MKIYANVISERKKKWKSGTWLKGSRMPRILHSLTKQASCIFKSELFLFCLSSCFFWKWVLSCHSFDLVIYSPVNNGNVEAVTFRLENLIWSPIDNLNESVRTEILPIFVLTQPFNLINHATISEVQKGNWS